MLKFFPGILLLQVITIGLVLIAPADLESWGWLRLAVPVFIVGFLTALWFGSISAHQRKDEINRMSKTHYKEREALRVNAERAKAELLRKAQRTTLKEVRRSSMRANIKVGLAFAGLAGLGGVLILTQFMSLGLLTLGDGRRGARWLPIACSARVGQKPAGIQRTRHNACHRCDGD